MDGSTMVTLHNSQLAFFRILFVAILSEQSFGQAPLVVQKLEPINVGAPGSFQPLTPPASSGPSAPITLQSISATNPIMVGQK